MKYVKPMYVWVVERKFLSSSNDGWFTTEGESFPTRKLARERIKQLRLGSLFYEFRVRKYARV